MTDLQQARSVEEGRFQKVLRDLETQQELRLSRIEAEMARRGLQNSDARLHAIFEARLERLNQVIQQRIALRREIIRNYPELGSQAELNQLRDMIQADVMELRAECKKHSLVAAPEVFAELRARAQDGIEGLKRDMACQVPIKPKLPSLVLEIPRATAGKAHIGPALQAGPATPAPASLEAVTRKVDEVIGDLQERNPELADALRRLAAAIKDAKQLPEERTVYLEQLQFVAEQAARVAVLRRISVVKGIMVALRTDLDEAPRVAVPLRAAFPLLASHFGFSETAR
ncbi:MAG TPA: hypothetical protein VKT49_16355 [Bryobacteraceae bacterium]|nr:hypothetical protein [Bryobacteraceae bacterium]